MSLSCHTWHLIIKVLESKVRQPFCAFNVNTVLSEYVYFDISWALWSRLNIKGCSVFRGGGMLLSLHGFGHKFSSNMGDRTAGQGYSVIFF